jgi:hypothetical protein
VALGEMRVLAKLLMQVHRNAVAKNTHDPFVYMATLLGIAYERYSFSKYWCKIKMEAQFKRQ